MLSKNLTKLRLLTLFLSILLITIISYFNPTAKERVIDKTLNQINILYKQDNNTDGLYIFSKEHTHHYLTAYKMYLDNKVFGVGVKNFRKFCSDKRYEVSKMSCAPHPHNSYVQILSEIGIIGFLFLIFVFVYFSKYILKHLLLKFKSKYYFTDFEICILSGVVIYLWPFIPTGNVFSNWINIAMILNLPFLIWSRKSIIT